MTHKDDEVGEEFAETAAGTASLLDEVLSDSGVRLETAPREVSGDTLHHQRLGVGHFLGAQ